MTGEVMGREGIVFFFHSTKRSWVLQCNKERDHHHFSES